MKYLRKPLSLVLRSPKTVFTFKDISIVWKNSNEKSVVSGINYYVSRGQIYRIRRGIYAKDKNYDKDELATRIYTPSYISFETILQKEGILLQPNGPSTTSLASYLTRKVIINQQVYYFRKVKDTILLNPIGIENASGVSIASKERAMLDTLYINSNSYFDNLDYINWKKVFKILPIYQNRKMVEIVNSLYQKKKDKI